MIEAFYGVTGFLVGLIVAIVGYILPLSNRLTRVETKIDVHMNAPVIPCPFHEKMAEELKNVEILEAQKGSK